jgi:hypothetical protein
LVCPGERQTALRKTDHLKNAQNEQPYTVGCLLVIAATLDLLEFRQYRYAHHYVIHIVEQMFLNDML